MSEWALVIINDLETGMALFCQRLALGTQLIPRPIVGINYKDPFMSFLLSFQYEFVEYLEHVIYKSLPFRMLFRHLRTVTRRTS